MKNTLNTSKILKALKVLTVLTAFTAQTQAGYLDEDIPKMQLGFTKAMLSHQYKDEAVLQEKAELMVLQEGAKKGDIQAQAELAVRLQNEILKAQGSQAPQAVQVVQLQAGQQGQEGQVQYVIIDKGALERQEYARKFQEIELFIDNLESDKEFFHKPMTKEEIQTFANFYYYLGRSYLDSEDPLKRLNITVGALYEMFAFTTMNIYYNITHVFSPRNTKESLLTEYEYKMRMMKRSMYINAFLDFSDSDVRKANDVARKLRTIFPEFKDTEDSSVTTDTEETPVTYTDTEDSSVTTETEETEETEEAQKLDKIYKDLKETVDLFRIEQGINQSTIQAFWDTYQEVVDTFDEIEPKKKHANMHHFNSEPQKCYEDFVKISTALPHDTKLKRKIEKYKMYSEMLDKSDKEMQELKEKYLKYTEELDNAGYDYIKPVIDLYGEGNPGD